MNKQILLFDVNEEQQEKIQVFCDSLDINVKVVSREDFDKPICNIAGFPKTKSTFIRRSRGDVNDSGTAALTSYSTTGFPEPMMVFCNLTQEVLNEYLASYAAAGIKKIALKAILTPHNLFWTPAQLFKELSEEHRAMTQKK